MYLRRLSQPAKEVFIDIAKYLCNADGIVDKREEKLLAAYGEELQMTISLDAPQKSLEALATNLNAATDRIQKRIVVFEPLWMEPMPMKKRPSSSFLAKTSTCAPPSRSGVKPPFGSIWPCRKRLMKSFLGKEITIHPHSGWFFIFGHSHHITGDVQVR